MTVLGRAAESCNYPSADAWVAIFARQGSRDSHCLQLQGVGVRSQIVLVDKVSDLLGEQSYCFVHLKQVQGREVAGMKKKVDFYLSIIIYKSNQ